MTDYFTDDEEEEKEGLTISAFYDDLADAEDAVAALRDVGIAQSQIVLTSGSERTVGATDSDTQNKGFFEMLSDFFFPDEDRLAYAEGLRRGGHMVTAVNLTDAQYDVALGILDDEGAVDFDERSRSWRDEGWVSHRERRSGGLLDDPLAAPYENRMHISAVGAAGLAAPGAISTPGRPPREEIDGELVEREAPARGANEAMTKGAGLSAADALDKDETGQRSYRRDEARSRAKVRTYVRKEPDWP